MLKICHTAREIQQCTIVAILQKVEVFCIHTSHDHNLTWMLQQSEHIQWQ
jgi:hypothetical protein